MADDWLGINSRNLDSSCGEDDLWVSVAKALSGTGCWEHSFEHAHWFIIDLGRTYTIKKVRGRSNLLSDPVDVNIYIDDNNPPTTLCEEGITTWQDRTTWSEITLTTEGEGRYIKVEIEDTENINRHITFGGSPAFTIFDAYGDVAAAPPARVPKPTVAVGNPLMF